jgi:hypothetical protein
MISHVHCSTCSTFQVQLLTTHPKRHADSFGVMYPGEEIGCKVGDWRYLHEAFTVYGT